MNTIPFSLNEICGFGLHFQPDGFRMLYACIGSFMFLSSMIFSKEYMAHYSSKFRYYFTSLVTYIATMGVFLSADLYTTFIFFEIMSFASYLWVVQDERKESLRAGDTYLAIAVIGGLVMLMGIFMLYVRYGTTDLSAVTGDGSVYQLITGILILFGFLAKAGGFPLHIWLPKAHPVAPAPASALLSGILTKAGVYGILLLSVYPFYADAAFGTLIETIGVITMFAGALLALFSVDLKRTLACSSVSQIGFILTGIGMYDLLGDEHVLAARGSLMHMVNHSMIKLLLFMAAGVVYMNLHELDLNAIRGFGRKKPLLKIQFLMGALGIGGIPLWNGYVSKTLIHESIVEYRELLAEGEKIPYLYGEGAVRLIEWIFIVSGAMTIAYMTKLFVAIFVEENGDPDKQKTFDENHHYMNRVSAAVLTLPAIFMPLVGMFPQLFADRLMDFGNGFLKVSETEAIRYFSGTNLLGALYSIVIGAFLYLVVVRKCLMKDGAYVNRWPKFLDLEDYFYRPLLLVVLPAVCAFFCRIADELADRLVPVLLQAGVFVCRLVDRATDFLVVALKKTVFREERLPQERIEGTAVTHFTGEMADRFVRFMNETVWAYHPRKDDVEHRLSMFSTRISENYSIIARSLSFALALASIGLVLVLLYMLL